MKHQREWTTQALANRADQIERIGSVADILGGEDHRSVAVFYAHDRADFIDEALTCFVALAAEVIGVVIGGDDPHFAAEVLSRSQAQELFGHDWIRSCEDRATEGLQ